MAMHATADPGPPKPDWALSRREADARAREGAGLPPPAARRAWPWVVLALLLLAAAALAWAERDALSARLAAFRGEAAPAAAPASARPEPAPPEVVQINAGEWAAVEPRTLRRTVKVIGTLAPVRRAELAAEASGQVESVAARPGDRVSEGDVLVQVDAERLALARDLARSNAEATRAQLALAQGQLDRTAQLVERGVSAEATLDDLQSTIESTRAGLAAEEDQVAAAELDLARATFRAPFDGVVSARAVEPGSVVSAGSALLTLVDLSRMEMTASAPIAAGAVLAPGQAVEVAVDGVAGRTFPGGVTRVAPVAAAGTRALTAFVEIDNADGTLLGGMFATGTVIAAEARDAIALPAAALREDEAGAFVLVLEGDALARRDVTRGEAWEGDLVQVTEGLAPGDRVVVAALPDLVAGTAVELVEF